jgi:hypothetical protein
VWARGAGGIIMAKKCARTFSIVVEKGKKSILDVGHLLPDALPRSVRHASQTTVVCAEDKGGGAVLLTDTARQWTSGTSPMT